MTSSHSSIVSRLDAVIGGAIAAERIVGAVVLVSLGGETIYSKATGFDDREAGLPMRTDAIFRLASVSKLFTATAVMALVGRGQLDLDRPITEWLPNFAPTFRDKPAFITLRHLLSHSAGLSYGFFEPEGGPLAQAGVSDGMDRTDLTLSQNIDRLSGVPLVFEPGSAFRYSLGIDVAGAVIEAATGVSLPEAMRDLVTGPLGLQDTGFTLSDISRLAAAYADDTAKPRRMLEPDCLPFLPGMASVTMDPARVFEHKAFPSGGAGMVGTASEILRLIETLRQGGGELMIAKHTSEMARDQIAGIEIEGSPGLGYGLSFSILRDSKLAGTAEPPGTWRWGGAYGHSWFSDPQNGLTAVALTNTAFEGMSGAGRFSADLSRAIYAAIGKPN
ncbi:serine hydrolase domain-containing protein [Neorhizobium alkalisoli]|uniref:CubicO group peptidase (Beta-lactamase class C family) n=1 Tax=Neorhizobium alkalisoli TaxID=528178 RepID=A0A561QAJ8_9HYPH|nr:serine hydrolase domain-containing protein [Neorhizobium alkalisoli]TWF47392.1 CubicO group peptidase (beta-lactamase class C family) [Neorhizobium alkalisoli]